MHRGDACNMMRITLNGIRKPEVGKGRMSPSMTVAFVFLILVASQIGARAVARSTSAPVASLAA